LDQQKLVEFCIEKNKLEDDILKNIEQRDTIMPILECGRKT